MGPSYMLAMATFGPELSEGTPLAFLAVRWADAEKKVLLLFPLMQFSWLQIGGGVVALLQSSPKGAPLGLLWLRRERPHAVLQGESWLQGKWDSWHKILCCLPQWLNRTIYILFCSRSHQKGLHVQEDNCHVLWRRLNLHDIPPVKYVLILMQISLYLY